MRGRGRSEVWPGCGQPAEDWCRTPSYRDPELATRGVRDEDEDVYILADSAEYHGIDRYVVELGNLDSCRKDRICGN